MQYLKKAIKTKIIASAVEEFRLNGFHEASVRIIAQNAGVSLGNVYRYFRDKEDVFTAVVAPFLAEARGVAERFRTAEADIEECLESFCKLLLERADEYAVIKKSATPHYSEFFEAVSGGVAEYTRRRLMKSGADGKVSNPLFAEHIGRAFVRCVLDDYEPFSERASELKRDVKEFAGFFFGRLDVRFSAGESDPELDE